jgi:hypothetical protein
MPNGLPGPFHAYLLQQDNHSSKQAGGKPSMRCEFPNILGEEEILALAIKWWGNGLLAPHYFEALKEAARLGAERAASGATAASGDDILGLPQYK